VKHQVFSHNTLLRKTLAFSLSEQDALGLVSWRLLCHLWTISACKTGN